MILNLHGIFIGFATSQSTEKRIFKVKEDAAVVLFSAHSLLLECTHSHIL